MNDTDEWWTDVKEFNNSSCWYSEKMTKTPLAQLIKKIKVQAQINSIRNKKGVMTTLTTKI